MEVDFVIWLTGEKKDCEEEWGGQGAELKYLDDKRSID
jgi:hypothetical protein